MIPGRDILDLIGKNQLGKTVDKPGCNAKLLIITLQITDILKPTLDLVLDDFLGALQYFRI